MRILLDANMGPTVGAFLTAAGHHVIIAGNVLPPRATDAEVAQLAIDQGLHVVTADRGFTRELELAGIDFPHAVVTLRAKDFPESPGTWLLLLSTLLLVHPEWVDNTHYLVDPDRIRLRKL